MGESSENGLAVKVNVGASARLNVELKTEIPKESSGRLVDAITDLIRPFSERRALKADKLRLQREEVLLEIAVRARKRLNIENPAIRPIPNKLLVPFLEKASLEDLSDSRLIDMWANLLATALSQEVELLGQYTAILSTISGGQAKIFERIIEGSLPADIDLIKTGNFIDQYYYFNQTGLPGSVERISKTKSASVFASRLYKEIDRLGVAIDTINVYYFARPNHNSVSITGVDDGLYDDRWFFDFENLCRLGLLDRVDLKQARAGIFDFDAHYYIVTPIGIDLYACCNPARIKRAM